MMNTIQIQTYHKTYKYTHRAYKEHNSKSWCKFKWWKRRHPSKEVVTVTKYGYSDVSLYKITFFSRTIYTIYGSELIVNNSGNIFYKLHFWRIYFFKKDLGILLQLILVLFSVITYKYWKDFLEPKYNFFYWTNLFHKYTCKNIKLILPDLYYFHALL